MTRPTSEQITAEIARLRYIVTNLTRKFNGWGNSNVDAIEAQIHVLEKRLSNDDVYGEYGDEEMDEFEQHTLDNALDALRWKDGDSNETPSAGWDGLYTPETTK